MIENVFPFISSIFFAIVWALAGWLLADFGSGVIHWAQDRYGSPRWPMIGGIVRDTIRHHRRPRGILNKSIVQRSWRMVSLAVVVLIVFLLAGAPAAFMFPLVVAITLSNEIHAAAHSSPKENGPWITALQRTGLIQSHKHHAAHHRALKNVNYCTITNWLNPVLERIRFWRWLEAIIWMFSRSRPRPDPAVRRQQRRRWRRAAT